MTVTIREVAREAGVSIATVSRVFNNSGPVNRDTRRRIEDIARRLNYVPSGVARSLITSRTSTLGVLLPDLYGEFFSEVIRGIDQTAQRNSYHVLVSSSHNERMEVAAALQAMRGRVDGMIILSPDIDADALRANLPPGLPVVLLNTFLREAAFASLSIDNFGGAYAMVQHLLAHGHRRIAHIRGPERNYDAEERQRGYRAAMRESGLDTTGLEYAGSFTEAGGFEAGRRIAAADPPPTAVFASNDSMAIGAISALREAGFDLPADMAVAGFDDIPMARFMNPPLTTVHVPINELGERAMEALLPALRGDGANRRRHDVVPTRLVVRASCGC